VQKLAGDAQGLDEGPPLGALGDDAVSEGAKPAGIGGG
jgi:hypothetical protein